GTVSRFLLFVFTDPPTTEISTLSLHDALPISWARGERRFLAEAVVAGLVVGAVHLLFRLSSEFLVGALNDDGVYVTLGKAIAEGDRKSTRLNSSHVAISYAVFCLKKKKK